MAFEVLSPVPTTLSVIQEDQSLQFDVRSAVPLGQITVAIRFPRVPGSELVFCADSTLITTFEPLFSAGSSVVPVVDVGFFPWRFVIRRDPRGIGNPTVTVFSEGGSVEVP